MITEYLKSYEWRTYFLVCFTIVGLVTSRAVMSIGVVAFFTNLLLELALNPPKIKTVYSNFISDKSLLALSFLFFASLIALSYSDNKDVGFNFLLNKLPLLVIPLAFSQIKVFTKKQYHFLISFFVAVLLFSSFFVLYKYFQDYEFITHNIKKGKAIWVPFNHIRYNVMLVFALISSIYLFFKTEFKNSWIKYIFLIIALYLFILIHFLSVRSGILVLYISIIVSLAFYILNSRKYIFGFLGLLLLFVLPYLAYKNIESFKNKVEYSKWTGNNTKTKT